MAIGEPSGAPSQQRAEEQEPIYEGEPGRTRLKSIHVPLPNGFVRTLQIYEVVNVGTDPHLRDPTLAGALHRFETGEVLAIPFVFHDPHARKLALVVPEMLRHEEMTLRAKLLTDLSAHSQAAIPSYVSEATTVIGVAGLAGYLERPAGSRSAESDQREATLRQAETQLEQRTQDLTVQQEALQQREVRLQSRAEQVTRREDELRELAEELDAARADLAMRERELESRLEMLVQRENDLAQQRADSSAVSVDDDVVQIVDEEDVDEVEDLEPLETSPGDISPDDLADAVQLVGEEPLDPEEDVEEIVDDVEELEEVEVLPDEVTGVHADVETDEHKLRESKTVVKDVMSHREPAPPAASRPPSVPPPPPPAAVSSSAVSSSAVSSSAVSSSAVSSSAGASKSGAKGLSSKAVSPSAAPPSGDAPSEAKESPAPERAPGPSPSVPPPAGFLESRHGSNAVATVHEDRVRIFGRVPEGRDDDLFVEAPPRLLAQLVVIEECPVVLLSVVEQTDGRPVVLRAPIDPRGPQRDVLRRLEAQFDARLALFATDGRYLRSLDLAASREGNVQRILARVSKMRTAAAVDVSTAIDRVLSAPPPVRAKRLPFDREPLVEDATAKDVAAALGEVAKWSSHDKLDHARLVLSVPSERVEATLRSTIERATDKGLALPSFLVERAIALGIAPDEAALVSRQLEAFRTLTETPGREGLSEEDVAEGWELLLKAAADCEVSIDTDTHEVAWNTIRSVRGGDDGPSKVDPEKLPELGIPQLVMLLEHPRYRRDAAVELANRKEPELADKLCKAVRKMPRAEVVRVVPRIVHMGDAVGDSLIDGLAARKTFVRQAFALGLGHLRLRRSVVPLLHLLASEKSDVWREIARVIGSFGTASLRTVTRQLKDPKGLEERYILTLAHLANHGCEKQVKKLTSDDKPAVATMASEALAAREDAKAYDDLVKGDDPMGSDDPIGEFSHRFYAELEGRAADAAADGPNGDS